MDTVYLLTRPALPVYHGRRPWVPPPGARIVVESWSDHAMALQRAGQTGLDLELVSDLEADRIADRGNVIFGRKTT